MKTLSVGLLVAFFGCASNPNMDGDDGTDDGKDDGTGTSYVCTGLGTNNNVYLDITKKHVSVTVEGVGRNTGSLTTSSSSSETFSKWTTSVFFGTGDTLVVPTTMLKSGSGTVDWYIANVNPYWQGTCKLGSPTGDQCMPLVEQLYPVDSTAKAEYTKNTTGDYSIDIPSSKVGDFVYDVTMHDDGSLCTMGDITATSCSAIVADKIGAQAVNDGSSSGAPYVSSRATADSGYTWKGGVHDDESGEFAYTVTTDGKDDGCTVTGITGGQQ